MAAMEGKTAVVTGATSGIGRETALGLARLGARVVMVARDSAKGSACAEEIRVAAGNRSVDVLTADLSSQASIRALAEEIKGSYPQLHVLINNAGGFFGQRRLTVDGLEYTFALNHLAYFLLANLLLDLLKASAPARVVNITSGAQVAGKIDFANLQGERRYSAMAAYSQSKLANVLFTYELARRLEGSGVTANCVHPGSVRTNFGRRDSTFLMRFMVWLTGPFMLSPARGAEGPIYVASSPEVEGISGEYFAGKKVARSSALSHDSGLAQRLWRVSEELTGLVGAGRTG